MKKKDIIPLPYNFYWFPVIFLSILGIADSLHMSYSHFRVYTDIGYSSFCAISKAANCDTVAQSAHSILLSLPVPIWGVIGYSFLLILVIMAKPAKQMWAIIFLVSISFSIYSIYLGFVSYKYIHSFCLMCFLSYVISFAFSYFSWIVIQRFYTKNIIVSVGLDVKFIICNFKKILSVFIPFACICLLVFVFCPPYWKMQQPTLKSEINMGYTEEGSPWIGALNPDIIITEFTDYQCFQCKKMHRYLRSFINQHPDKIRLIHRHYPMDKKFNNIILNEELHSGAGYLSLIAIYAKEKGDFWKVNDLLYDIKINSNINLSEIAQLTGYSVEELIFAVTNSRNIKILQWDILTGAKMQVVATPSYLINGEIYKGLIPKKILENIID